jgi:hypothetical protein
MSTHAHGAACAELTGGGAGASAGDDYEVSPPEGDAAAWGRRAAACAAALAAHHARQGRLKLCCTVPKCMWLQVSPGLYGLGGRAWRQARVCDALRCFRFPLLAAGRRTG